MAEPKFYTRNYIDDDCDITSSHGSDFLSYLFDRDKDSQYVTDGAGDDATEVTLTVVFNVGGVETEREIDSIILIGHNLKNPSIEQWDGSAWQALDSESALTSSVTVFSFDAVTTSRIRIIVTETQVADEEKEIGEFIACKSQAAIDSDLVSYQPGSRQMATDVRLADGSIHRTYVRHSVNRTEKYEARVQFQFLNRAKLELLRALKESGEAFLFYPESTANPDEIYLVHWFGAFSWKFASEYKDAGVHVTMDLKEA